MSCFRSVCSGCEGRVWSCELLVFRLSGKALVCVLDLLITSSTVLKDTEELNVETEFTNIELPTKPDLDLFVECLKMEGDCSVSYTTGAWEKTVTIPFGESATFPASNTRESLSAVLTPSFYRQVGDVEVTLQFYATSPLSETLTPEAVDLNALDLKAEDMLINGSLKGEIEKVAANTYRFTVSPASEKASFAVILPRELRSERGLRLHSGVLNGCIFDDEAPYLVNTQYLYSMMEEENTKTLVLALNEAVTVSAFSGVVVSVTEKEGFVNTYEVVVEGSVGIEE